MLHIEDAKNSFVLEDEMRGGCLEIIFLHKMLA